MSSTDAYSGVTVVKDPQLWTQVAVMIGVLVVVLRQFGGRIDARFDEVDRRFDEVDRRFDEARNETSRRFDEARSETGRRFDEVYSRFDVADDVMKERFDHQGATAVIRFGVLERRVAALEDDMKLVKQHLIPPAA
ncbi:hypothetical protein [Nocardioides stalactiti]|uniref:hypothetical protein n=1 Tax=Nocardioides stalactiti TaxID=2755356 RepID=UPI0015FEDA7A|nr:hypothetical protein [Nocardioides stalactiti]